MAGVGNDGKFTCTAKHCQCALIKLEDGFIHRPHNEEGGGDDFRQVMVGEVRSSGMCDHRGDLITEYGSC